MEYDAQVSEQIYLDCIGLSKDDLRDRLGKLKKFMVKHPRIPSVLHRNKQYNEFTIVEADGNYDVFLLTKQELIDPESPSISVTRITMRLNINFYSHDEILAKLLPDNVKVSAFEIIGEIAHLNLTSEQLPYKETIAKVIHYKTGLRVINKVGAINNVFRNYSSEILAGDKNKGLQTIHSENNIRYFIDLERVYWCSRLQSERSLLVRQFKPGESVCDPFCGAGPHVLPALKMGLTVYANDLNPAAAYCIQKSVKINKLPEIEVGEMDAKVYIESLRGRDISHFIFNLPKHSLEYVPLLKDFKDYTLHCFFFCKTDADIEQYVAETIDMHIESRYIKEVRKVSPSKSVYKLEIKSSELKF
ncbi:tRNA (guanine37-N1)-methyltransferase [Enteropsectra breve]|nr:tRNA (guanine37-N1)-methyltransferase [Enteropsectra breve]